MPAAAIAHWPISVNVLTRRSSGCPANCPHLVHPEGLAKVILLRLLAPLLLIILVWWGLRRIRQQYSLTASQFRWLAGAAALLLIISVLIVVGRLPVQALVAPLLFLGTFALRNLSLLAQLWNWRKSQRGRPGNESRGGGAGKSSIRTAWLAMELTHSSGQMDGEVLKGQYKGERLSRLDLTALLALARECRNDTDSVQLLEAYLDRTQGEWRDQVGGTGESGEAGDPHGPAHSHHGTQPMTEALALEILGLDTGAKREQIVAAHRRLMQKMHPDRGGSDYLAQRINEARDFLLDRD